MKIMVIDGNSILNRAFYGIKLLSNKEGLYTNAVYGFLSTYFKLLDEENPDRVIVCFDVKAKTFRHNMYEGYKAQRKGMPDELAIQLPLMKDVLAKMGVFCTEKEGYEADDLIGTMSVKIAEQQGECVIVTGDKDSLQLVNDNVRVKLVSTRMGTTTTTNYTPEVFFEKYGFEPRKIIDLKALMGDASDNIPGVAGVGEKTAMTLIQTLQSLDGVYSDIDNSIIKKGMRQKLIDGKDSAYLSYDLATINTQSPLDFDPMLMQDLEIDKVALYDLMVRLEFKNFIAKLGLSADDTENTPKFKLADTECITLTNGDDIRELFISSYQEIPLYAQANLSSISFYLNNIAYVIHLQDYDINTRSSMLKEIFGNGSTFITYDAKAIARKLSALNIDTTNIVFDIELAEYLLNPTDSTRDLDKLIFRYLGLEITHEQSQISLFELRDNKADIEHLLCINELYKIVKEKLEQQKLLTLYTEIEHPLIFVLADMEVCGIKVDKEELTAFSKMLDTHIISLEHKIFELSGEMFNINSPKQLGELLFEKLKLPIIKKTKTGYSTNVEVLEKLIDKHEIIPYIMEFRTYSKLKSTYADGLLKVIDENDGRIHTSFKQTVTATGRLSSTEPNLQNIPVRTKLGREIRKMFIADDGYVLVDADYSQIELRVLAHIANDEQMIKAFNENQDIHAITASEVLKIPLSEVTSAMRSSAKAVNFGIVYGISDFALSQDIGVTRKEAGQYIANYLEHYSGIRKYMEDIKEFARVKGYVKSMFGRKRTLTEINAKNFNLRSMAERMALNTPIQATAADIIKIAMIKVHAKIKELGLKSRLILQVHDELIIETTIDEVDVVKKMLCDEMENVTKLSVPLLAEAVSGNSWYDTK